MLVYFSLLLIIIISIYNKRGLSVKENIFIIIGAILFLMITFRGSSVDKDYNTYLNNWELIKQGVFVAYEPLNYAIAKISPNFFFYLGFYSVLGISLKLYSIWKMSSFPLVSLLIYYSHYFFLHEMTQIRIGVASGFFLISIYFLVKNNKYKSLICNLFAILFHYSAVVGLIIYFINYSKKNLNRYIIFFIISISLYFAKFSILNILSIFHLGFISDKISLYNHVMSMGEQAEINVFNVAFIIQLVFAFLLYKLVLNFKTSKYTIILTKLYWLGLSSYVLFTDIPAFAFRISEILMVGEIIIIPSLIYLFKPKIISKFAISSLGVGYFILYVVILKLVNSYSFS